MPPRSYFYFDQVYINDKVVVIFPADGGEKIASKVFSSVVNVPKNIIIQLAREQGLEGDYIATVGNLIGNPTQLIPFTAEVPKPAVTVSFD